MSLALSLCQYVLRSKRGLAQASPGLAQASPSLKAPRLQAFEARDLLHQHNRKGQVVMIKTRRYKRLVFGFVFCTWNWYDFWKRSGGLPCSRPLLPTQCWFVWCWCVSTLEQGSGRRCRGGLKTGPSRRHRIQPAEGPFLGPRAEETCLKKGQKVDPLEIKSGPPWRVQFWSLFGTFIVANLLRRLFQVEADLTSTSYGWNLELGRPIFARLLFLGFWGPKKDPFFVILFCSNFHGLEALEAWLEACLEACPDVFCSNFHARDTGVEDLHWGLPPTLFHPIIFLAGCNFHNLEASSLALRPSLCASCGLKF